MAGRTPKPWFWKARKGWYVKLGEKNIRLASEAEGHDAAMEAFYRLMAAEGRTPPERALRVRDVFNLFLHDRATRAGRGELAQATVDGYQRFLRSAAKSFGNQDATKVQPFHVANWLSSHAGWGETTRFNAITAVKAAFRWAKRQGRIPANNLADVDRGRARRREATPTDADVATILDRAKDRRFRDLIELIHETGGRPGELMRAEAADVIAGQGGVPQAIVLREHKTARKTGDVRTIYLNDRAASIVARLVAERPSGPLLVNRRGNPWTRNAVALRLGRLGVPWSAYSLRHKWITDHLEAGTPIATVAELAGHRDTTMISRVYSRLSERRQHLSEAARRLNRPRDNPGSGQDDGTPRGD